MRIVGLLLATNLVASYPQYCNLTIWIESLTLDHFYLLMAKHLRSLTLSSVTVKMKMKMNRKMPMKLQKSMGLVAFDSPGSVEGGVQQDP